MIDHPDSGRKGGEGGMREIWLRSAAVSCAGFIALGAITAAHGADLVVIDARGLTVQAGQVIDDTKPLVLKEGQRITLIAANGNTLKLRGPYDQAPGSGEGGAGAGVSDALKALIVQKQSRTSDVGVVRAGAEAAKLPEPWLLDVSRPGIRCVRDGDPVVFWRPASVTTANLTITPLDKSWKIATTWPSGADRLVVPPNLPVQGASTYLVGLDETESAITVNSIPGAVSSDAMRAAWMIEKGCQAQAEALLTVLR
jgi:hypothetical protein